MTINPSTIELLLRPRKGTVINLWNSIRVRDNVPLSASHVPDINSEFRANSLISWACKGEAQMAWVRAH
jgi:hypothetical protein